MLTGGFHNCKKNSEIDGIKIIRYGRALLPHFVLPIFLLKYSYDVVIADLGHAVPWAFPVLLRKRTVVSFLHLHRRSLKGQVNTISAFIISALERCYFIIYHKSNFVTISNSSYSDLLGLGIRANKISLINPGYNNETFKPANKTGFASMVYFGGLREYKRPEIALYTISQVRIKFPNAKLFVVGEGPMLKKLKKLSDSLCLKDNVNFTGLISRDQLAEYVASAWLNLHCSETEGWGISITEASGAGTPTVAFSVPGVTDAIEDDQNGIKVKDGDINAFVEAALKILRDPVPWQMSSRKVAEKYSWDETAKKWDVLIRRTVEGD